MSLPDSQGIRPVATIRLAISPDGRRIAYTGGTGNQTGLWVRELDQLDARYLTGTEGAMAPFFSPDGRQIGFLSPIMGPLKTVPAAGGPVQTVLTENVSAWGADWAEDGNIYFTDADLFVARVSASGGQVTRLSKRDSAEVGGATEHDFVSVLPNGRGALVQLWMGSPSVNQIGVLDFASGEVRPLVPGSYAKYLPTGHILLGTSDGRLHLVPFDQDKMITTGSASVVLEGLQRDNTGGTLQFAVSRSGTLIYQAGTVGGDQMVVWVNRTGQTTPVDSTWVISYSDGIALAPDESRMVVSAVVGDGIHLFVKSLPTGAPTRLTFEGTTNDRPAWSPDGSRVGFLSTRPDGRNAWVQVADGSSPATRLTGFPGGLDEIGWSPDGHWLVGRTQGAGRASRKILAQQIGTDSTMRVLVEGNYDAHSPALSPDGQWLAYVSDESGTAEVYVRPFPDVNRARYSALMNVPSRSSEMASWSSASVFMTIGPYHATGSSIGRPDTSRNRTPSSPAWTTTSSPVPNTTSDRLPVMSRMAVSSSPAVCSVSGANGLDAPRKSALPSKT